MEHKENMCQPPEYPTEMCAEYFESAKVRALRTSAIETIIGDDYDLDRLRELVEAERDGRCVVLPCKVGDTVYIVTHEGGSLLAGMEIVKCQVNTIRVKSDGHTIGYSCRGRYSNGNHYIGNFVFKSIGKTVFLTREAAEAALKGEQDEKH